MTFLGRATPSGPGSEEGIGSSRSGRTLRPARSDRHPESPRQLDAGRQDVCRKAAWATPWASTWLPCSEAERRSSPPGTDFVLGEGDELVVRRHLREVRGPARLEAPWRSSRETGRWSGSPTPSIEVAELELPEDSAAHRADRSRGRICGGLGTSTYLAILRGDRVRRTGLRSMALASGDRLLVATKRGRLAALEGGQDLRSGSTPCQHEN